MRDEQAKSKAGEPQASEVRYKTIDWKLLFRLTWSVLYHMAGWETPRASKETKPHLNRLVFFISGQVNKGDSLSPPRGESRGNWEFQACSGRRQQIRPRGSSGIKTTWLRECRINVGFLLTKERLYTASYTR